MNRYEYIIIVDSVFQGKELENKIIDCLLKECEGISIIKKTKMIIEK